MNQNTKKTHIPSSAKEIEEFVKEIENFISRLKSSEISFEWGDDFEQLEQLDKLQSTLKELEELAADSCDDIGHPLDGVLSLEF